MQKPILLLQFRLPPTDNHEVECIVRGLGISIADVVVKNIALHPEIVLTSKDWPNFSGVIWGASSDFNVTDWPDQLKTSVENLRPFLLSCLKNEVPTLGICFGHQTIAYLLGGEVERNKDQAESGVVDVFIQKNDPIFGKIPKVFSVSTGHKDSVTSLPKGATLLASSQNTPNSIYRFGSVYGVQQHPELTAEDLVYRMSLFPEYTMGRSLDAIKKEFREMPDAVKILRNFKKIVDQGIITQRTLSSVGRAHS